VQSLKVPLAVPPRPNEPIPPIQPIKVPFAVPPSPPNE